LPQCASRIKEKRKQTEDALSAASSSSLGRDNKKRTTASFGALIQQTCSDGCGEQAGRRQITPFGGGFADQRSSVEYGPQEKTSESAQVSRIGFLTCNCVYSCRQPQVISAIQEAISILSMASEHKIHYLIHNFHFP
jgi:hypothetical protein